MKKFLSLSTAVRQEVGRCALLVKTVMMFTVMRKERMLTVVGLVVMGLVSVVISKEIFENCFNDIF